MALKTKVSVSPIILAAGYSSRMKKFKPLLPLGDKTILERVISVFQKAGFSDIHAVVGHRADDLTPILEKLQVHRVINRHFDKGMFSSVLAGTQNLRADQEAFFIMPVDVPLVKTHTVLELYKAFEQGEHKIYYPCFKGERGHPPLISAELIPDIIKSREYDNLSLILNRYEDLAADVEVPNEDILFDVDNPSDYQLLLKKHKRRQEPSIEECYWLLEDKFKVNKRILAHSQKVASVALTLGKALQISIHELDLNIIHKAALLHDLLREQPRHASRGAEVLAEIGYPFLAEIVAEHADISLAKETRISEKEIVYLADKLVENDKITSVDERFGKKLRKYGDNQEIAKNIIKRKNKALKIQHNIEEVLGKTLDKLGLE